MSDLARRTRLCIKYNGKDITADISEAYISGTWNDKSANEADDLTIELEDKSKRWSNGWFPSKGATLEVSMLADNWDSFGESKVIPWGTFQIDEIEISHPSKVNIKGVSTPITSAVRGQAKTKAWENVRFSKIAGDIASSAALSLMLDIREDPFYQREDQMEESDLSFVQSLCSGRGYSLKVSHGKIIVFDQEIYEAKAAVAVITPDMLKSYSLKTKSAGIHSSCKVSYHDPETNEDYEHTETWDMANFGGDDVNGRELVVNERVKGIEEAQVLAKKRLRESNKYEVSGSITAPMINLFAGTNVILSGFGKFDGKYILDSVSHKQSGAGYDMSAQIRKAMPGKSATGVENIAFQDFSRYGKDFHK